MGTADANSEAEDREAWLWRAYWASRSIAARNALAEFYLPFVRAVAAKTLRKMPSHIQLPELLSAGSEALLQAIPEFDPQRGVRFQTFAFHRIGWKIVNELRRLDPVPRGVRAANTAIGLGSSRAAQRLGRRPQPCEIAAELDLSEEEFMQLEREASLAGQRPLEGADGDSRIDEKPHDARAPDPSASAEREDLLRLVTCGCSGVERLTLILRYYEGLTITEIAEMLGFSTSYISLVHSALIKRVRARLEGREDEFNGPERS